MTPLGNNGINGIMGHFLSLISYLEGFGFQDFQSILLYNNFMRNQLHVVEISWISGAVVNVSLFILPLIMVICVRF